MLCNNSTFCIWLASLHSHFRAWRRIIPSWEYPYRAWVVDEFRSIFLTKNIDKWNHSIRIGTLHVAKLLVAKLGRHEIDWNHSHWTFWVGSWRVWGCREYARRNDTNRDWFGEEYKWVLTADPIYMSSWVMFRPQLLSDTLFLFLGLLCKAFMTMYNNLLTGTIPSEIGLLSSAGMLRNGGNWLLSGHVV